MDGPAALGGTRPEGQGFHLSGGEPYVSVRRRLRRVRGEGLQVGPPKTKTSRRDIPIPVPLADRLAALHTAPEAWVFTSNGHGTPVDPDNVHSRVLRPACEEADCSWAGFHTFRHTVASRLIAEGRNVVQVSRFLGHANAHTTLSIYGHLDGNVGGPLVLSGVRTKSPRTRRAKNGDRRRRWRLANPLPRAKRPQATTGELGFPSRRSRVRGPSSAFRCQRSPQT
jgi:Phage integrase family